MDRSRAALTSQDWIKAGFLRLTHQGISGLKAEVLAQDLAATKGSFYWHFKDVPSFRAAMLALWRDEATAAIIDAVNAAAPDGQGRLLALIEIIASLSASNEYGGVHVEPAIRDWARLDPTVSNAVRHVDEERIAFVSSLFQQCGSDTDTARERAALFYAGFVGLQALASVSPTDNRVRLRALLCLLQENPQVPVVSEPRPASAP
ncbi:MAG: TetR/AcrR family transcriptional regulator [Tabrizicola sp.]|nr:TetR/AcrR family transcriptional regulator [Tabrizicola sp.]